MKIRFLILIFVLFLTAVSCGKKELDISGQLDTIDKNLPYRSKDEILETIYGEYEKIEDIYYKALKTPEGFFSGKVVVEFTIQPDGTVTNITKKETTCNRPDFEEELIDFIGSLDFGYMPTSPTPVEYPFVFEP
jgi:hypothetical protein